MKGLQQAAARGVAWNLAQNLLGRVLALAVIAILGRILAKSDFGAVAVCLAVTAFGELLATQGYGEFIAHRKDISDEHLDTAFWLNAALGIVLTLLIILCAGPLAKELGEPSVTTILRVLSLSVLIRAVSVVPTGMLMRELKFRSLSLRSLAASVLAGIVGIIGALTGLGIWSLVLQVLIGDLVSTAVLWRATAWRPGFRLSRQCLHQLNSFGAPVLGAAALVLVGRRLDIMLIAGSLGLVTLASYSMAQRLFHIANQVLNKSSDAVTLSALARLVESPDRRRDAFYKIIELSSVLYFPVYAGLALLAEPLIVTIFSARWLDSTPILIVFGAAGVPLSLSYLHAAALKSVGRTRLFFVVNLAFVTIYVPLLLVMLSRGPTYAALAYLFACVVILPLELVMLRASLGIRIADYARRLAGPFVATAVMCAVTLPVVRACAPLVYPAALAIGAMTAGLSYVLALRFLARGTFKQCTELVRSTLLKRRGPAPPAG